MARGNAHSAGPDKAAEVAKKIIIILIREIARRFVDGDKSQAIVATALMRPVFSIERNVPPQYTFCPVAGSANEEVLHSPLQVAAEIGVPFTS